MDPVHRALLRTRRLELSGQLLVSDTIVPFLYQEEILTETQVEDIESQPTNRRKTLRLLDLLPSRGPRAFHAFLRSLDDFNWVRDRLLLELRARPGPEGGASRGRGIGSAGGLSATGGPSSAGGLSAAGGLNSAGGPSAAGGLSSTRGFSSAGGPSSTEGPSSAGGLSSAGGPSSTEGPSSAGGLSSAGGPSSTEGPSSAGGLNSAGGLSSTGGPSSAGGLSSTGGPSSAGGPSSTEGPSSAGGLSSTVGHYPTRLPDWVLWRAPSDRELSRLASRLGAEWEEVLMDLGLSAEALFRCRSDHPLSTHGAVLAGLVHWRRSDGKKATVQRLVQSLEAAAIHPSILEDVLN